ncbi:Histidine kinase hhk3p [Lasiodiplodia theobromae]|uniref:Histidine kinase hhk3p n=1 Tax=Lasiodiplodia theobromae TaxID=45133 RepID=UPI0015C33C79|nr:Histidine kinase hhk3p [Lasiodiplodia theobromae]KAF4537396.1 Histidine kinase hhk3p [Lasiodiplodia theobromae]
MTSRRSYFPKSNHLFKRSESDSPSLPRRPSRIAPIFDQDHADQPLPPFDEHQHAINYAEDSTDPYTTPLPPEPADVSTPYLYPTLCRNERLRLTMLWYYTKDIADDEELLQKLQGIVRLVRSFIGWEYVIMGILSENTYHRLVTHGVPLAILPRRESTCAHTINQTFGLFVLPNMLGDWRFRNSPHVQEGGLRSYAGAQLRCETENGQFIALGSLCVAANSETEGLSADQQAALSRFADILSAEIVNRSRINRQRQRQAMGDTLSRIKSKATQNTVEDLVKQALRDIYPGASVTLQDSDDGTIELEDRPPISFEDDVQDCLWEDTEFLETLIRTSNHRRLESFQTIRAMVARCQRQPIPRFLVVSFKEVQLVLDDVDAWFVESCAIILFDHYHERLLAEALKAKDIFLRGITHQLRTPIHGILGSVELLGEELFAPPENILSSGAVKRLSIASSFTDSSTDGYASKNARLYLQAITNAGRELMSTVNNVLMLNRWAESSRSMKQASYYELNLLEADILRDISLMLPEEELALTSVLFDNQLTVDCSIVTIDIGLLKECLQSLILNAIQSSTTKNGSVLVIITATSDYSILQFDIKDTGIGICKEDQRRIFEAYEKGDSHTRGVGLGLTISSKIAASMNGSVSLVSSEPGKGSHFRVELRDPGFACPTDHCPYAPPALKHVPRRYHEVPTGQEAMPLVRHFINYLEHRGWVRSDTSIGALNIVSFCEDEQDFQNHFKTVDPTAISVCLIPARVSTRSLRLPSASSRILFFEGPFLSTRLYDILYEVNETYAKLKQLPEQSPITNGVPVGPNEQIHDVFARKMRIVEPISALLVDDNAINLRIFKLYCEKRHIPYACAVDGNEAVAQYRAHLQTQPLNLIFMDLQMPNCDGVEATKQIRDIERACARHAAIIFMITGQDSPRDKAQSKEAGADEFFVKPTSIKTLDQGIARYFEPVAQRDIPVG